MRKFSGLLLALTLLLPATFIAATTAGAAGTGLSCTKLSGSVKWTPPIPRSGAGVKSAIVIKAGLTKCTGTAGITGGTIVVPKYQGTTKQTCQTLFSAPPVIHVAKGSVATWNNKAKSTFGPLTLTPAGTATYNATSKITKGPFVGKTLSLTAVFTPNGCPIKSATLALKKNTKATIK